jgi:hypothetical protein
MEAGYWTATPVMRVSLIVRVATLGRIVLNRLMCSATPGTVGLRVIVRLSSSPKVVITRPRQAARPAPTSFTMALSGEPLGLTPGYSGGIESPRGPSIPGYPSLTVGYPTELQKGGIDIPVIPPGVKMLGCQLATTSYGLSRYCRNYHDGSCSEAAPGAVEPYLTSRYALAPSAQPPRTHLGATNARAHCDRGPPER